MIWSEDYEQEDRPGWKYSFELAPGETNDVTLRVRRKPDGAAVAPNANNRKPRNLDDESARKASGTLDVPRSDGSENGMDSGDPIEIDHTTKDVSGVTIRQGADIEISAKLVPRETMVWNYFGATFRTAADKELLGWDWNCGLEVTQLREYGPAEDASLAVGDVVVAIGEKTIETLDDIHLIWQNTDYGKPFLIKFLRGQQETTARMKWDVRALDTTLAKGKVLNRTDDEIVVSLGTKNGVYPGDRLDTRDSPGGFAFGEAEVVTSRKDQSRARILSEQKGWPIQAGNPVSYGRLKRSTPPEPEGDNVAVSETYFDPFVHVKNQSSTIEAVEQTDALSRFAYDASE